MRTGCLILLLLLLLIVGGIGFLMVIDLPAPSAPVERVIPNERLPR